MCKFNKNHWEQIKQSLFADCKCLSNYKRLIYLCSCWHVCISLGKLVFVKTVLLASFPVINSNCRGSCDVWSERERSPGCEVHTARPTSISNINHLMNSLRGRSLIVQPNHKVSWTGGTPLLTISAITIAAFRKKKIRERKSCTHTTSLIIKYFSWRTVSFIKRKEKETKRKQLKIFPGKLLRHSIDIVHASTPSLLATTEMAGTLSILRTTKKHELQHYCSIKITWTLTQTIQATWQNGPLVWAHSATYVADY